VNRDDYVHAIVSYFTVDFSKCHSKIAFSTGPRSQYTHWKQTVFYLDNPITAMQGENITGSIKVKRNGDNPRDIDIHLETDFGGTHGKVTNDRHYRLR
jgi:protein arginine N-methyltransferase 1